MKVDRLHVTLGILLALGVGYRAIANRHRVDGVATAGLQSQRARLDSARSVRTPRAKTAGRRGRSASSTKGVDSAVAGPRIERTPLGAIDPAHLPPILESPSGAARGPRVNVNSAGAAELDALPGVGPGLARRILEHRRAHGPFGSLDELGKVKGLGKRLLERLAPHVTFASSGRPSDVFPTPGTLLSAPRGTLASLIDLRHELVAHSVPGFASLVPKSDQQMAAPAVPTSEKLVDSLLRDGIIVREQYDRARQEAKQGGSTINYALVKLGFIPELELTKYIARGSRMPAVDLSKFEVDPRIIKLVPAELASKHLVLPLKRDGRTLTVAVADPGNLGILEDLKFITRYDIFPVLAGEFTLRNVIDKQYDQGDAAMEGILKDIALEGEVEVVEDQEEETSAAALAAAVDDAPVVKLINAILTDAVKRGASDIHFECFEHELRVRYRIDGALQEVMKPPLKLKAALISRFKIMAQLNIAERRVPQDGRIKLKIGNQVIDYRVSTLPTLFGEKVVLRILDKGNLTLDLEKFGIEPAAEQSLMEA
ncbi:MAG: Flp pilus assembly complex ATPase component TadA, partial [Cytophagaceae bacterium]|nr:Flp pilus assembly complex ATPase component TadA [Gemmatimonadaceae bacterium]